MSAREACCRLPVARSLRPSSLRRFVARAAHIHLPHDRRHPPAVGRGDLLHVREQCRIVRHPQQVAAPRAGAAQQNARPGGGGIRPAADVGAGELEPAVEGHRVAQKRCGHRRTCRVGLDQHVRPPVGPEGPGPGIRRPRAVGADPGPHAADDRPRRGRFEQTLAGLDPAAPRGIALRVVVARRRAVGLEPAGLQRHRPRPQPAGDRVIDPGRIDADPRRDHAVGKGQLEPPRRADVHPPSAAEGIEPRLVGARHEPAGVVGQDPVVEDELERLVRLGRPEPDGPHIAQVDRFGHLGQVDAQQVPPGPHMHPAAPVQRRVAPAADLEPERRPLGRPVDAGQQQGVGLPVSEQGQLARAHAVEPQHRTGRQHDPQPAGAGGLPADAGHKRGLVETVLPAGGVGDAKEPLLPGRIEIGQHDEPSAVQIGGICPTHALQCRREPGPDVCPFGLRRCGALRRRAGRKPQARGQRRSDEEGAGRRAHGTGARGEGRGARDKG